MADKKQLISEIKEMRGIIETQIDHCDAQIARFKKSNDKAGAADWLHKGFMAEKNVGGI